MGTSVAGPGYALPGATGSSINANLLTTDYYALFPRVPSGNWGTIGTSSGTASNESATLAAAYYGGRIYKQSTALNATDGTIIGGYRASAENYFFYRLSTSWWSIVFTFRTPSVAKIANGWILLQTAGVVTNVSTYVADHMGFYIPSAGGSFKLTCADGTTQNTTPLTGVTPADSTYYALKLRWNGNTSLIYGSAATINSSGQISAFSAEVSLSANLPRTTVALGPTFQIYQGNTPGSAQVIQLGMVEARFVST